MCGSLLSKFRKANNEVDPGVIIFPEPRQDIRPRKPSNEDSACHKDRGFWENGAQVDVSEIPCSLASTHQSKKLLKNAIPSQCEANSLPTLDRAKPVLPAINSTNVASPLVAKNSDHLLESAREILAIHGYRTSSSCNAAQPLTSVNSTFPEHKTAVAFDIAVTDEKTVYPSARVPLRLRRRGQVAPEITLADVQEKMRLAEERKLKELERIRDCARSRADSRARPHPADVSAKAIKEKIATKQAAAERKREEKMAHKKQAGSRVSQKISRIAQGKVSAKTQLESTIERKMQETEKRKVKQQQKGERKKKQKELREKYAKKVKDRVS